MAVSESTVQAEVALKVDSVEEKDMIAVLQDVLLCEEEGPQVGVDVVVELLRRFRFKSRTPAARARVCKAFAR